MKKFIKNILIALIIFVVVAGIFSLYNNNFKESKNFSLSELAREIRAGNIQEITVAQDELDIKLKDGSLAVSRKENSTGLTEALLNLGVTKDELSNVEINIKDLTVMNFISGIFLPIILPFIIIIGFFYFTMRGMRNASNNIFSFGSSKARVQENAKNEKTRNAKTTFKDVAGAREAKEELSEVVDFLKNPGKFVTLGARIPHGVLLVGPPGTGKTLLAKAVAGEAEAPFFNMSGSEFVEMFVGVGASRVRDLFRKAKKASPAIVFLDEIDAVGRQRGAGLGGSHDEREQTLNQILVEMDGFDSDTNVIVIAATNRPDVLDPALLRPGRFDRRVVIDLPDIDEREEILKLHAQGKLLDHQINLRTVAERTPGFSGADLANVMNEAAILTARKNLKATNQACLNEAIEKVLLGPERKSHILTKEEKRITAYHEAGHALVAHFLPEVDPVQKISIISRGQAGGYTLKMPEKDKHMHSKKEFLAELSVFLGGYIAEKIIFQDVTTGAGNDLKEATALARKLVMEYGMNNTLGPIVYGEREELVFLGRQISEQRNYSEKVASRIDQEVRKTIKRAYKKAWNLLSKQKKLLEKVAVVLIKEETLEKEEFEKLVRENSAREEKQVKSEETKQTEEV